MLGLFSYFSLSVSPFLVSGIVGARLLDLLQLSFPAGRKPPLGLRRRGMRDCLT